jgi:molybdopterin-guanine dinucleotide biosynthesis protein A
VTRPLAAILVGGESSRLGRDKALAKVGGVPLVRRVLDVVGPETSRVFLVGREGQRPPIGGVELVTEDHPERCALAGVVRALERAGGAPVLVAACDHPFLEPALVRLLLECREGAAARVPEIDGRLSPLLALYRSDRCLAPLAERLASGRLALHGALRALDLDRVGEAELRTVDPDLRSFVNVNRPEDLERARRIADAGQKI